VQFASDEDFWGMEASVAAVFPHKDR
jgi:hypothetical protein